MAAKRCSICGINYPDDLADPKCKVCDESLAYIHDETPDEDWVSKIHELLSPSPETTPLEAIEIIFIAAMPSDEEDSIYPHKADNRAHVSEHNGQLFVTHQALLSAGYEGIEAGTIVYLNDKFYEVEGYAHGRQVWWVTEIDPEKEFADLPVVEDV